MGPTPRRVAGSMRQRSPGSWELRVSAGVDPTTKRSRYVTKTVHANRADAQRELAAMVDLVGTGPSVGARTTVVELLERWFAASSGWWAPTTIRSTRSILDRQLHPHLGAVRVGGADPGDGRRPLYPALPVRRCP